MLNNTICAVATPPGEGGISVIRVSGDDSLSALRKIFTSIAGGNQEEFNPKPRYMHLGVVKNSRKEIIDRVLAVYMPAPHSYTGEDVVEFQCHGGYVVTQEIIKALLNTGVVMAEPGEFTQRAFINGKMNLTQAEAVIDIIQAKSAEALKISEKQLEGRLGQTVLAENDKLLDILAQIEVAVDYPEEEQDIWENLDINRKLMATIKVINELLRIADDGKIYSQGLLAVIAGPANAGKSTLLNALLQEERAIVTDVAGTTRDTIEEYYNIKGVPVRLADTAGIRNTEDVVEAVGIERSRKKLAEADLVLLVWDISQKINNEWCKTIKENSNENFVLLLNKTDILPEDEVEKAINGFAADFVDMDILPLSAKNNLGVEAVKEYIYKKAVEGKINTDSMTGLVNDRQKSALLRAKNHLTEAVEAYETGIEGSMLSIDIQAAWEALAEITGGVVSDDIISRVFSRFCLGK